MIGRRKFSKLFLTGSAVALSSRRFWAAAGPGNFAAAQETQPEKYDLLIKGGVVVDPGQQLHAPMDAAVKNGKVFKVARDLPESMAAQVFSAKDRIVTPGLIDIHLHCYDGI